MYFLKRQSFGEMHFKWRDTSLHLCFEDEPVNVFGELTI